MQEYKDNMITRIIQNYCRQNNNVELINATSKKCVDFIECSQLPTRYIIDSIDTATIPGNIAKFRNMSVSMLDGRDNSMVCLKSIILGGYIAAMLIETYLNDKLLKDEYARRVLYIDTPLLLEDFKKLMDKDSGSVTPQTYYAKDIIYKDIYTAEYVIWDKFNLTSSLYDLSKLQEILTIRYNQLLPNMFICYGNDCNELLNNIDKQLLDLMDAQNMSFNFIPYKLDIRRGEG